MENNEINTSIFTNLKNISETNIINSIYFSFNNLNSNKTLINTLVNQKIFRSNIVKNLSNESTYPRTFINNTNINRIESILNKNEFIQNRQSYINITNINYLNNKTILQSHLNFLNFDNTINNNISINASKTILDNSINFKNIIKSTLIKNFLNENNKGNNINQSKTLLPDTNMNKSSSINYGITLGIFLPIILVIIFFIFYCIKRKKRASMSSSSNDINDLNRIKFKTPGQNLPYNKLQNTSGVNNININPNNMSMSEIKVQNLKDEIHNIISNSSGSSSSSGRRKRNKKKSENKNNIPGFSGQNNDEGAQNEIKEQIKQYVMDEQINN